MRFVSHIANLPDVWGEGALFAFSGLDGPTHVAGGFVAAYGAAAYDLLLQTPRRRIIELRPPHPGCVLVATGDVLAVAVDDETLLATWSAWHTLLGCAPRGAQVALRHEDDQPVSQKDGAMVSTDTTAGDTVVLRQQGPRWAVSFGDSFEQANQRAAAVLADDPAGIARQRLAVYADLPAPRRAENDRLLKKCFSVMRVNTLAAEGAIRRLWSTPDRVPHRDMWLWDSVFHALGMRHFRPAAAWDFIRAVLETQRDDGMIPHQTGIEGRQSAITQPPLLAWGVWELYQVLREKDILAEAAPHLERYLLWDQSHRDSNDNGLLEWFIDGDVRCRSGESGLDNSPRFDEAAILDAVDFSVFAARDMSCLASIHAALGDDRRAQHWRDQSARISRQVHNLLWDERAGFYVDRHLDGRLSSVQAVTGFLPLLLDDLPPGRAQRLAQALADPRRFAATFPVPSVALNDPEWSTDMWRGATWINLNYLVIRGLARQGLATEAANLTEQTLSFIDKYYRQYGVVFEFYDAQDTVPPPACCRKGPHREPYNLRVKMDSIRDYHWTAALTADLLLT